MKHIIKIIQLIVLACFTQGLLLSASEQTPLTFHLHIDQGGNINVPHANNAPINSFGGWFGWICSGALKQAGYAAIPLGILISGYALFWSDYYQKYATIRFTLQKKDDICDWIKGFFGKDKKSIARNKKLIKKEAYLQTLHQKEAENRALRMQLETTTSQYYILRQELNNLRNQASNQVYKLCNIPKSSNKKILFIRA